MKRKPVARTRFEKGDDTFDAAQYLWRACRARKRGVFGEDFAQAGVILAIDNFGVLGGKRVARRLDVSHFRLAEFCHDRPTCIRDLVL